MDKQLIAEKLEALRVIATRLAIKIPPSPETLKQDIDLQDIIVANLTRSVQICVDIAAHIVAQTELKPANTMAEGFDQLVTLGVFETDLGMRLKKATGFRNLAVHAYDKINWDIVYAILPKHLSDFKQFAAAIETRIDQ